MSYTIDQTVKQQVLQLIGWNEEQYTQFIYDCGLAYLQQVVSNESEEILSAIRRSEVFWNWWKLHWEMRDMNFIEICDVWDEGLTERFDLYLNNNHPPTLAQAIYLNGEVLQESYATMIHDLHKSVHNSKVEV